MCPRICTVHGNVERNIPDKPDALFPGISMKPLPLCEELKLNKTEERDLILKFLFRRAKCVRPALPVTIVPVQPALSLEFLLERAVQTVVVQPVRFSLTEFGILFIQALLREYRIL